jgi:superfamily II DNA/RNA helicase
MLDMGFIPDIEKIFSLTPFTRQTFFYSATMAPEIERITNTFLSAAVKIEVARQNSTSDTITQKLIEVTPSRKDRSFAEKRAVLRALIRAEGETCTNAIILCNRKMDVDVVSKSLKQHGFNASPIHGDLDQSVRTRTLEGFRDGSVHLLVASDVAARGLDIPAVSHVFNFDMPTHPEDYVHRIGRTGRAGREGKAFTLSTPSDAKYLTAIEALVGKPIPRGELPEGIEVKPARPTKATDEAAPEKPKRSRSRTRTPKAEKPEAAAEPVAVTENVAPVIEPQPVAETPRAPREERSDDRRKDNRNDNRNDTRRNETRNDTRNDNRRDDRNDNRRSGGNDRVVGMGDHVPDFILRSFRLEDNLSDFTSDEADESADDLILDSTEE